MSPVSSCLRSTVVGLGSWLPQRIVSNADLEKTLNTTDKWIVERTGIKQRHIASKDECTSILGCRAAEMALRDAQCPASEIDLVIVATTTPDYTFPSVATQVQSALGLENAAAFDLQAVCSGFIFALATADKFLVSGSHRRALVVGAETLSRVVDWNDRSTSILFGDGAGAVVLEAQKGGGTTADRGILTTYLRSDGRHGDKLHMDGGPSTTQTVGKLRMDGREVFRIAVSMMTEAAQAAFDALGITAEDIDWFVPHQANRRIIDASAEKLGIAPHKVVTTIDLHGNTSAASVPLALCVARDTGRIKRGDLLMIEAVGGGLTWGAALIRW